MPRRGGGRSAAGARAQPRRDGSGQGNPSSPPQAFDPRVAGFGDPDLEAVEAGLELAVRRDPDDEGIDQEGAAGAGRLLRHPADGLLGDPEPDLVAGGAELGPEPEGPVRFPGGLARGQGSRGLNLRASTDRELLDKWWGVRRAVALRRTRGYRPDSCRNTLQGGPAGRVVELAAEQPPRTGPGARQSPHFLIVHPREPGRGALDFGAVLGPNK